MAARRLQFDIETIHLDAEARAPQYQQLEDQLRSAIQGECLAPGARLPSSRSLAATLSISRNTVLTAYEQLISEGYLEASHGFGTSVIGKLPESVMSTTGGTPSQLPPISHSNLSESGRRILGYRKWTLDTSVRRQPFCPHLPAIDEFPLRIWNRLSAEQARRFSTAHLIPGDPQGYPPLREAVAQYMGVARGVACSSQQVIITSGAQQGLSLTARLLLDRGDEVWMEEPGNLPAYESFQQSGAIVIPVPVDAEGIRIDEGRRLSPKRKLIYVTPGAQWPTGAAMSLPRRLALIKETQLRECWIIEDDYNGEFRYHNRPHPPLCGLDSTGRTIYMGTFSKMLFPSIRMGFLIVPESLASAFATARWIMDRYSSPLLQMVLHRFIEEGHFARHIRIMRSLYAQRQAHLHNLLHCTFGDTIHLDRPESGMHLILKGRTRRLERQLVQAANRAGIQHHLVSDYAASSSRVDGMILGFAAFNQAQTQKAVARWKSECLLDRAG